MCKNSLKEISILIIEDEVVLSLALKSILEDFGYKVSGIETNMQGVMQHLSKSSPNLAIVDIKLQSSNDGINIAKYLWQVKKTPIIFLTSYCDEKTIERTLSCEPYGYLIKPCKDKELHTTIQTAINKHNYFFKNKETFIDTNSYVELGNALQFHRGKTILYKDKQPLKLTKNETKLIELLCAYPNESVSYEKINNYIWRESLYDLGKLRTLVYRLKQKVNNDIIESVFDTGYKLKVS